MNLREVVKRYGKDVGLNLRAVRAYASQMFLALALMRKCEIMHADLKPDNILVSTSPPSMFRLVELLEADAVPMSTCRAGQRVQVDAQGLGFGVGVRCHGERDHAVPRLAILPGARNQLRRDALFLLELEVARRRTDSKSLHAPVLGLPYDCSLDVWSIACTLYELYTGKCVSFHCAWLTRRCTADRAPHQQDLVPRPDEQSHALAHHGDKGQVQPQVDPQGSLPRPAL